jgi:hypothetical protein
MITRIRLVVLLVRPAVICLLVMFAVTGLAQAGRPSDPLALVRVLMTVTGFLLFSVACKASGERQDVAQHQPGQTRSENGFSTLSTRTVQNHVQNTLSKLQLHNKAELVRYALEQGVE